MTGPNDLRQDPQRDIGNDVPHPPSPVLRVADAMDRIVSLICRLIVLVSGIALLALLFGSVVARYTLGGGFAFAQELPERIFPFFIMAGVALAAQRGGHMAVEALPELLPRVGNQILRIIAQLFVIVGHAVLVYVTLQVADISWIDLSPVLSLPASYSYYALAAGSIAVIIATVALTLRLVVIGPEAMPVPNPEETGQ